MHTAHRSIRLLCAAALTLGLLFIIVGAVVAAPAHAKVDSSDPKANSTIQNAPKTISVHTAENMKQGATNSNLFVYGPAGELISQGDAKVDLNNPARMSVDIKPDGNGVYVVRWVTVSADDGDPDQGAFVFTVGSAASSTAANTTTTTTNSNGTPLWVAIVTGIIALIVGAGAGIALSGRSRKPTVDAATGSVPAFDPEGTGSRRS